MFRSYCALGLLDGDFGLLDLLAQVAQLLHALFLGLPLRLQRVAIGLQIGQLFFELGQPIARGGVLLLLQRLALDLQLHGAARDFVQLGRHAVDLGAQLGGGLIDEIDGLIRQKTIRDVAIGQHGGGDQGGILDADAVMDFVALAQAAQDRDGVLDRRLIDHDRLEAAFQRGILLDVLAIFVERGRADAVQFAAASMGLSRLPASIAPSALPAPTTVCSSSMNRMISPCASCTSFSTALRRSSNSPRNLAPAMRAPMSRATMRSFLQPFRHVAADDALGQTFDDGRLADARARRSAPGCSWCGATAPG